MDYDDEDKIYCAICEKHAKGFETNHLKSQTNLKNFYERKRLNNRNTNNSTS